MKQLALILSVVLGLIFLPSCEYLKKAYNATTYSVSTETSDQILIRSEQLTKQALYTFDTFVFIERNNEKLLLGINPQIHVDAERVRKNGKRWLQSARQTTETFKANRTEKNAANMRTAYITLKALYDEVKSYQSQLDQANKSTP